MLEVLISTFAQIEDPRCDWRVRAQSCWYILVWRSRK